MSKSTWCQKSVFLAVCVGACRLLTAGVIYVAPELPEGSDGSGSSWANAMTSVNDACAAASATGGGEVWVKKGYYNIIATISLGANVKVIGGFAGDETDAMQADPEANPTVLGGLTHKNGAKYTPKWSCSGETSSYEVLDRTTWKLNLPPENWFADYDRALISAGTGGMGTILTTATGSTGALVRGITLYATYTTVITVTASTDLEIDSCLFASCQGGVKNRGTVNIHDSKFVGCYAPFYSETTSTADCIVNRCTMLYCKATSNTENIISFRSGKGKVMNSEIRRCWSIDGSSWFCCLLGSGSVTDTLFEDNTIANDKASIYGGWSFSRCVFRGMLMKQENSSQTLHAACINFSGETTTLEDMVFENNKVAGSRAETSTGTHVWTPTVYSNGGTVLCINCTFLNNTNEVVISETDKSGTIVSPISGASYGINFVNCVFSNNRAPTDVYAHGTGAAAEKDAMISAFNTIFHSDAKDYQPFSLTSLLSPGLANCCISRWEEVKDSIPTGNNGYLYNITDQDPKLDRSVKTGENGVVALGVGPESPYRKTGRGIWKSSDGRYWFYDDILTGHEWRWRNVQDKRIQAGTGAYLKTDPPPGINADFSSPILPDAFDAERKLGKVAYGPINAAPHGLVILLR